MASDLESIRRHMQKGEFAEAEALIRAALQKNPFDAALTDILGVIARGRGHAAQAIEHFTNAVAFEPANALYRCHLAIVLRSEGRFDAAWDVLEQAVAADPGSAEAHTLHAEMRLARGDYVEGFQEYEWRVGRVGYRPQRALKTPRWTGDALAGKTLLVLWEQSDNDVIQFCRYLPMLRALFDATPLHEGARIVFDCPGKLIPLIKSVGGFDAVGDYRAKLPRHDAHVPLMSLPWVLGTRADAVPGHVPYLTAPPTVPIEVPAGHRKVGICLPGQQDLAPLLATSTLHVVSLDAEAEPAAVAQMDLVISIDAPVLHTAGALGRTAWALLALAPDWRWGLAGDTTLWYPTMRLFRQSRPGDWSGPMRAVEAALSDLAAP